jgi:hypothetical protein
MLVCALLVHIAHETAGAARIRHSLRPLISEDRKDYLQTSGAPRRGIAMICLCVEYFQSSPFQQIVIPGRAKHEPGINTPDRGYGFRAQP